MNICEHLIVSARLFPDREAIVFEQQRLNYRQLEQMAARAARVLRGAGVERGDRVGILLPNTPAFVVWYYGALRLGAVAVSLSTRLVPREVGFMLADCQARVLVTEAPLPESLADEIPDCVAWTAVVNESGDKCNDSPLDELADSPDAAGPDRVETEPDEPALILYTSGTTGMAKGATLSHQNVRATVHAFNHLCEMRPGDRILLAVPLFHCYGQNALLNSGLNVGATIILQRRFDLNQSRRLIADEKVNRLFGVPTTFQLLAECCEASELQSVEYCFSAAAPLPIQLGRRWQEKYSMPIYEGYGLTETAPFASYNHRLRFVPGSIGTPVDLCEMKIVNTETGATCPPGELGEIAIRGPNVMLGYWNRPADTSLAIRDGWFHSGDIGRMDENGYFFIVDRVKDMIAVGGLKVYPAEVERILLDHEAVSEAAVVGFPDSVLGEKVVAFIVPAGDGDHPVAESIRRHCQAGMADFKVPGQIVFVEELPRNPAGKVLKTRLRETDLATTQAPGSAAVRGNQSPWSGIESPIPQPTEQGGGGPWADGLRAIHPAGRQRRITSLIQEEVRNLIDNEHLPGPEERFIEAGMDSLMIVQLRDRLQMNLGDGLELPATLVFDHPRICDLASFLAASLAEQKPAPARDTSDPGAVHEISKEASTAFSGDTPDHKSELARRIQTMSEEQALQELMREINE